MPAMSQATPLAGRSLRSRPHGLLACLAAMPLDRRFAVAGSAVTLVGMAIIGSWVQNRIESSVTRNAALSTAVYMESFIAPLSQELAEDDVLSATAVARLRTLLGTPPVSDQVVSTKIWKKHGLIAFSSNPALIGQNFATSESQDRAWQGHLTASFDELDEDENAIERARGLPLLEVYNPIHSIVTGEIIAVAEFYQNAEELEADLFAARVRSWALVATVTLMTFATLFGIVRNGSNTIARQNRELTARLAEVAAVSAQNEALRQRIQAAALRVGETNERQLRRISAELHDGPAQALALASLRLDSLARRAAASAGDAEVVELRRSLDEALHDIRNLCRGLTLPEIEGRGLVEVIEMAVTAHERRTGTKVARSLNAAPRRSAPHSTLICVYRFVQEALMNAFRHAGGAGQQVACRLVSARFEVSVQDSGQGFDAGARDRHGPGLGLNGLRERVESIGGEFRVESAVGHGTRLTMTLPQDGPA